MKMKVRTPYEAPEAEALVVAVEENILLSGDRQISDSIEYDGGDY